MSEIRRAWTPERVERLLDILGDISMVSADLAAAELRVGDILEKALNPAEDGKAEAVE